MLPKVTEVVLPVLCTVWQEPVSVNATLYVPAKVSTVSVYSTKKKFTSLNAVWQEPVSANTFPICLNSILCQS